MHERSWRAVWAYSAKRAARDTKTLTLQENRAKAVVAGEKVQRAPRFVKTKNGARSLDEAALARARRLVGQGVRPQPARHRDAHGRGHRLLRLAVAGRGLVPDDQERPGRPPVFHHERDAIEAHLTVVMAALAIGRHLQDTTGLSIKKIVRALRPLQQITVNIAGHEHTAADPLTDTARGILTAAGTTWPTH